MPKRSELKLTKRAVDALSVDAGDALFCDREQAGFGAQLLPGGAALRDTPARAVPDG